MTPLRAPKMSGTLRLTAPIRSPGIGMRASAAAQVRKANMKTIANAAVSQRGTLAATRTRQAA